jgi:FkbM family methyltransferase
MKNIELKEGWYWPNKDTKCWGWLQNEKDLPLEISNLVKSKRVMIQAGGNCGFYTKLYAQLFETVYTFEPDELNFQCLVMNLAGLNVYKQQACLGDERKLLALTTSKKNIGAYSVDATTKGVIPTLMIDDLGLDTCDLIHLDIEGWEFPALRGAVNTIKRCNPVIALEWMDHGVKFDFHQTDIENWLIDLGYNKTITLMNEKVFVIE